MVGTARDKYHLVYEIQDGRCADCFDKAEKLHGLWNGAVLEKLLCGRCLRLAKNEVKVHSVKAQVL